MDVGGGQPWEHQASGRPPIEVLLPRHQAWGWMGVDVGQWTRIRSEYQIDMWVQILVQIDIRVLYSATTARNHPEGGPHLEEGMFLQVLRVCQCLRLGPPKLRVDALVREVDASEHLRPLLLEPRAVQLDQLHRG